jgi:hypothetical protein
MHSIRRISCDSGVLYRTTDAVISDIRGALSFLKSQVYLSLTADFDFHGGDGHLHSKVADRSCSLQGDLLNLGSL